MNQARRKTINTALNELRSLAAQAADLAVQFRELHGTLEGVKDEEQEAFNNLNEGLQTAEMGQTLESNAGTMETALDSLDTLIGNLESVDDDIESVCSEFEEVL